MRFEYRPTARQRLFHSSQADEALYGGAAGGGKTTAMVADAFLRCAATPGVTAYLFRRTYPELEDTLIATARRIVPPQAGRYVASAHELRLHNGSILRFRHVMNDRDVHRYQGAEMQYLYIDELTHFPQDVVDFLKTRVRARVDQRVRPLMRYASNPGGPGHGWVRQYFVDPNPTGGERVDVVHSAMLGQTRRHTIAYIPAGALDNPHLSRGYVFELERKPEALRRALLNGHWDAFEGQVFTEWRDDGSPGSHVVPPFTIPADWPRWCSFDFGYSRPFSVGWWAVDSSDRVYRVGEWYGCTGRADDGLRLDPASIARGILAREAELGFHNPVRVADPSIFDESRGLSVARQMADEGVHFLPGDNSRLPGKMQLHDRLRPREDGEPGLFVFQTCRAFRRTVPALVYSTLRPEDVDTAGEDHVYDETRYFLMAHPIGRRAATPPNPALWRPPASNPFGQVVRRGRRMGMSE